MTTFRRPGRLELLYIGPAYSHSGEPMPFATRAEAARLLRDLASDEKGRAGLRGVYASAFGRPVNLWENDKAVFAELAHLLVTGDMRVWSVPVPQMSLGSVAPLAAAGAGAGPGPAPPKPVVHPRITPPKLTVVVAKTAKDPKTGKVAPYTHPKRQAVHLSTDSAFDGTGTFTCDKPALVKFWSAAKEGTEIKFDGKDNVWKPKAPPAWAKGASLASGVTVYVEALKPSSALDDITLKLSLSGGSKTNGPDDTSKATSVELTLDICQSSAAGGAPLSTDDKIHAGRSVLVQAAHGKHERAKLVIRQAKPAAFKGELVLKAIGGHVKLFAAEKHAPGQAQVDPLTLANDKIPRAGEVRWAEGGSVSGDMRDAGFTLGLKGVEDDGDHVKMTVVELKLDICHKREKKGVDPAPLADADKLAKGRYLLLQNAAKHPRAMLVVHEVKPKKFDGKIVLEALAPATTELFTDEIAAAGQAVTASPHEIDCKAKNETRKFWVEGKATSGALIDAGYILRIKDHPKDDSDRVNITVVELEIEAKVPTTPSARGAFAIAAPKTHHVFKSKSGARKLADNAPTVLVRNSPDVLLKVTTKPAALADFAWSVEDNPGPAKSPPVVTPVGPKNDTAKLKVDAAGGYAIHGGVGDASVIWNVVLVELLIKSSTVRRNGTNFVAAPAPGYLSVSSGSVNIAAPATCAMYAKAKVKFFAGGDASLDKYLDKVHAGIVNVLGNTTAQANYTGGTRERERIPSVSGLPNPVVNPATAVVDLGYPILDRGGAVATRATGGKTIYLSKTQSTPVAGKERLIETCDSPAVGFDALRPEFGAPPTKKMTSNSGVNAFLIYLVAYSEDADYTYVAFGKGDWTADYSGSVVTPAGATPIPVWTRGGTCGVTGSSKLADIKNGQSANLASCEVRPPVYLTYILDAR